MFHHSATPKHSKTSWKPSRSRRTLSNMHFFVHEANNIFTGLGIIIEGISDVQSDLFFMGLVLEDGIESFLSSFTNGYRSTIPNHLPISFAFFPSSSIDFDSSFVIAPHLPLAPLLPLTPFTSDNLFNPMHTYGKYK